MPKLAISFESIRYFPHDSLQSLYFNRAAYICENGIENAVLRKLETPEMLLEEKQLREQIYSAVMALPEKQAKSCLLYTSDAADE